MHLEERGAIEIVSRGFVFHVAPINACRTRGRHVQRATWHRGAEARGDFAIEEITKGAARSVGRLELVPDGASNGPFGRNPAHTAGHDRVVYAMHREDRGAIEGVRRRLIFDIAPVDPGGSSRSNVEPTLRD